MASKRIEIDETTYNLLKSKQQDGETLSDVIDRLLGRQKHGHDIKKFFGIWKELPAEDLEIMQGAWNEARQNINRRFD